MFKSYAAAKAYTEQARNPSVGRPLWSRGWRTVMRDEDCAITLHDTEVGRYKPDNTFVFTLSDDDLSKVRYSLSSTGDQNTLFNFARLSPERFRVYVVGSHEQPEYFAGLTYDLTAGGWTNARPDLHTLALPEKRREWLRALREWKRSVKTLARLGVLERIHKDPTFYRAASKADTLDKLYEMILARDVSPESLGLLIGCLFYWDSTPDSNAIYEEIERLVAAHSYGLRKRFGVFGGDQ